MKYIDPKDLLVEAEDVETGKRITGYVCCCEGCQRDISGNSNYDHTRPTGLLTHPNLKYGNVRVYTDTMLMKY